MNHLSLKAFNKRRGKKIRDVIHSDIKQIHMRDNFLSLHWKNMSLEKNNQTLEYHLFLKEKRYGTIKGRTVAGGNKQRYFISK